MNLERTTEKEEFLKEKMREVLVTIVVYWWSTYIVNVESNVLATEEIEIGKQYY